MLKYSNYLKEKIQININESFDMSETNYGNNHPLYDDKTFVKSLNFFVTYFKFGDEVIELSFYQDKKYYYVKFKIGDFKNNKEDIKFVIENKLDVRRNDALKIFNRVIFVIKQFTDVYDVEGITFEGARSNLQNLYSILVNNKRFLSKMKEIGFHYIDNSEDEGIFTFRKD